MSWNDAMGTGGKSTRDENHLQIKPDQTVKIHILLKDGEEPLSYWTHFIQTVDRKNRGVICPGRDVCPACANNARSRRQHAVNVWDFASSSIKILEAGNSIFQQLKMILDQYGSFSMVDIGIKRVGEKLNTAYMIMPMPRSEPLVYDETALFDLDILKSPNNPQDIHNIMHGTSQQQKPSGATEPATKPAPAPIVVNNPPKPHASGAPSGISSPVLPFGKYKGKSLEEVAQTDLNYVRWCADNIQDTSIRTEAGRIIRLHDGEPVGNLTAIQTQARVEEGKTALLQAVQQTINDDPRYKGNITIVVTKMREATKSPSHPNGKTLLFDYTEEELKKLRELLT